MHRRTLFRDFSKFSKSVSPVCTRTPPGYVRGWSRIFTSDTHIGPFEKPKSKERGTVIVDERGLLWTWGRLCRTVPTKICQRVVGCQTDQSSGKQFKRRVSPLSHLFGVPKWILFVMTRNLVDRWSKWEPSTVLLEVFVPSRLNRQRLPWSPGFSLLIRSRTLEYLYMSVGVKGVVYISVDT
jgi:hypothetical protein